MIDQFLQALGFVGDVVDTPGRFVRSGLSGRNPFESVFDPSQGASGRDLLEAWGILDPNTEGLDVGDVAGFGAEVLLDPLNLLGAGLVGKTAKTASKVKKGNKATLARELNGFTPDAVASTISAPSGWLDQFQSLSRKVSAAEKPSTFADLPSELQSTLQSGSWEDFSRARGYSDSEIRDYGEYLRMANEGVSTHGINPDALQSLEFANQMADQVPLQSVPSLNPLLAAILGYNVGMAPERGR